MPTLRKQYLYQFCFLFFITTTANKSIAQFDTLDFIRKMSKVIAVDSQYYLVINLSVEGDQKLEVKEKHYYSNEISSNNRENIQFIRWVRGSSVSIHNNSFRQPLYDHLGSTETAKSKIVDKVHPFIDTILLDNYIPLEIGEYSIFLNFAFDYKNVEYIARYIKIPFKVDFIPPKSIFND